MDYYRRRLLTGVIATGGVVMIDPPDLFRSIATFTNSDGWPLTPAPKQLDVFHVDSIEQYAADVARWDGETFLHPSHAQSYVKLAYCLLHAPGPEQLRRRLYEATGALSAAAAYQHFDLGDVARAEQYNRLTMRMGDALDDATGKSLRVRATTILARMYTDRGLHPQAIALMDGLGDDRTLPDMERAIAYNVWARAVAPTGDVRATKAIVDKADKRHVKAVKHLGDAPPWLGHHLPTMHRADTGHALADVATAEGQPVNVQCAEAALERFAAVLEAPDASPITKAFCTAVGGKVAYLCYDNDMGDEWARQADVHVRATRSARARRLVEEMLDAA